MDGVASGGVITPDHNAARGRFIGCSVRSAGCGPAGGRASAFTDRHERLGLQWPQGHLRQLHPQRARGEPHPGPCRRERGDHARARRERRGDPSRRPRVATGVYPTCGHGWVPRLAGLYPASSTARSSSSPARSGSGDNLASPSGSSSGSPPAGCSTTRGSTSSTAGWPAASSPATRTASSTAPDVLYSLQHVGYTIPPTPTPAGSARPARARLPRPGQRRPGERLHQPQHDLHDVNLMHLARMLHDAGGVPAYGNVRSAWNRVSASDGTTPDTADASGAQSPRGDDAAQPWVTRRWL